MMLTETLKVGIKEEVEVMVENMEDTRIITMMMIITKEDINHTDQEMMIITDRDMEEMMIIIEDGGATEFEVTDRGICQNAYEIKGFADSHQYMLNIQCPRGTVKEVQDILAKPVVGAEEIILRYMFFKQ